MSLSALIRDNRVLVAGLVLPLILVGFLGVARTLSVSAIPAPLYPVLFYTSEWSDKGSVKLSVTNGHLNAAFTKSTAQNPTGSAPKVHVYLFDGATETTTETVLSVDEKGAITIPSDLAALELRDTTTSPDSYTFEPYHYRNNTMITDIFSGRSYDGRPALVRKGKIYRISTPSGNYGTPEFIGWSIPPKPHKEP